MASDQGLYGLLFSHEKETGIGLCGLGKDSIKSPTPFFRCIKMFMISIDPDQTS